MKKLILIVLAAFMSTTVAPTATEAATIATYSQKTATKKKTAKKSVQNNTANIAGEIVYDGMTLKLYKNGKVGGARGVSGSYILQPDGSYRVQWYFPGADGEILGLIVDNYYYEITVGSDLPEISYNAEEGTVRIEEDYIGAEVETKPLDAFPYYRVDWRN